MKTYLKYLTPFILLILIAVPISANLFTGMAIYNTKNFNHHFQELTNLEPNKLVNQDNDDIVIKEIWINVREARESADLQLTQLPRNPAIIPKPKEPAYKYFEVSTSNILPSNTAPSKFIFVVEKEWISENNIHTDKIVMKAFNAGTWLTLETERTGKENNINIEFEATTPLFFKYYAILGEELADITPTISTPKPIPESTPEPTTEAPTAAKKDLSTLSIIIILIFLIAAIGMKEHRKPLRKRKR